jgi:hypothetical protein
MNNNIIMTFNRAARINARKRKTEYKIFLKINSQHQAICHGLNCWSLSFILNDSNEKDGQLIELNCVSSQSHDIDNSSKSPTKPTIHTYSINFASTDPLKWSYYVYFSTTNKSCDIHLFIYLFFIFFRYIETELQIKLKTYKSTINLIN